MNLTQRKYTDQDEKKKFRYAYVMKPSFDFGGLKPFCEKIIFAVDGWGDHVDNIRDQLEKALSEFDDGKDVIIPVGTPYINMLAGSIVQRKILEKNPASKASYAMGIYARPDPLAPGFYYFWRVASDPAVESYEIIQI